MSTSERPSTAGGNADKKETAAAAQNKPEGTAQDQAKKDRPKRNRKNKKGGEGENGQQEPREQEDKAKGEHQENTAGKSERKPKQQYRKKEEAKDGDAAKDGQPEKADDGKKSDTQQAPRKQQRKGQSNAGGQEVRYRPKTAKSGEDGATPNGAADADGTTAGEGDADGKAPRDKKKKDDGEVKKNLVYQNPMDFKETKKFKSKWEEYRLGDWRRGSGKTYVTLETVIPAMPEKPQAPPDEAAFHKKLLEIEDKIKSIGQDLEDKKTEFDGKLQEKIQARQAGEGGKAAAQDRGEQFRRLAELKNQRKKIYEDQEAVAAQEAELRLQRDRLSKKIDRDAQTEDQIPRAVKRTEKQLQTQTLNNQQERELMARIKFLKASAEPIRERAAIEEKLRPLAEKKKKISADLPKIKAEIKELGEIVDEQKKAQSEKQESRDNIEKELDKINDKRKRARDERDKLYKLKYELKDEYYGALINYSKEQFLIKDINWMTDMQGKLKKGKAEKERREAEYQERQERLRKEREEKARREEERKQREAEKRQRELDNKKRMEEQLQQKEVDQLDKILAAIDDKTVGSNPFFEQIEQCEKLTKYCQTQKAKLAGQTVAQEDDPKKKEEKGRANGGELAKALASGKLQQAPVKDERDTSGYGALAKNKGKKGKKNAGGAAAETGGLDFAMLKRFASLKVTAPLAEDSHEATIQTLKELREALIYWGKILQRQRKIKHIRGSRKLKSLDEYTAMAEEEEKWLQNEKEKIENAEDDIEYGETKISLDKIKIAQTIDKEMRMKDWGGDEDDSEDESDGDRAYTVDDMGDEENPREEPVQKRERKPKSAAGKPKQSQRPNAKKFNEIMNNGAEAFPTLGNEAEGDGGDSDDK